MCYLETGTRLPYFLSSDPTIERNHFNIKQPPLLGIIIMTVSDTNSSLENSFIILIFRTSYLISYVGLKN